jgi:hypothetical protein
MKNLTLVIVLFLVLLLACSSNKLAQYELRDTDIAAQTFMPPRANVFTELDLHIDTNDLIRSAIRIGTSVAKEVEAAKARARLDSAMALVDVPAIIEEEVLLQAAEMLDFRPVNEVHAADFIFTIDMKRYGIDASGWDAGTYFVVDSRVELIDNVQHRRIWKGRVKAREPLSPAIFGLNSPIENILDAVALSELSVDEMASGLEYLANFSAEMISEKLYRDFIKSRK